MQLINLCHGHMTHTCDGQCDCCHMTSYGHVQVLRSLGSRLLTVDVELC